jgi:hypothetical protein
MATSFRRRALDYGDEATGKYLVAIKRCLRILLLATRGRQIEPCATQDVHNQHGHHDTKQNTSNQENRRGQLLRSPYLVAEKPGLEAAQLVSTAASVDRGITKYAAFNAKNAETQRAATHTQLPKKQSLPLRPKGQEPGVSSIRGGSAPSPDIIARTSRVNRLTPRAGPVSQPTQTHIITKFNGLSVLQTNTAIKQIICKDIRPRVQSPEGHIYAFKGPRWTVPGLGNVQPIKIGHTSGSVEARFKDIARSCHFEPRLLFAYPVPHSARYEALVHATLQNHRWREESGCTGCKKKHQEWFVVECEEARRVVRLWALFAAHEPYDEEGVLKEEWRRRLDFDETDLEDPACWDTFVCGSMVDDFINLKSRVRMSEKAMATPGILEAGAVTRTIAWQEDAGIDDEGGRARLESSGSSS